VSAPTRPQAPASEPASQDAANIATDAVKPAAKPPTVRAKHVAPEQVTGAQSVIRSLEELDVEVIFGIPGGAVLPVYDPLFDSVKLRHVLVRHEQGAGHAASGYAHATGKVGVCMATSGPGATNLVTPLADAQMDSVPVVAITGQVGRSLIGTDAFQEADISGITMPITKHNFLVRSGDDIPRVMAEAFHIASSGRPVILNRVDHGTVRNQLLIERGIKSLLGVPLLVGGQVVGVLHVGSLRDRPFGREDAELLQLAADRAALAVQTMTAQDDRQAALALQRSLRPQALPAMPGLELAARYVTGSGNVGGDWYDVFVLPSGELGIVVGDVAGSGLPAAVIMGRVRSALRAQKMLRATASAVNA